MSVQNTPRTTTHVDGPASLAGSDTTAISLRAIFYYLLHNPSAYQTLQREVDDAHQAGKLSPVITYAESLELKYLYGRSPCRRC